MKIDNLVRIVDGVLQTTPSIDAFEEMLFNSAKVSRGNLFIDTDGSLEAIEEAVAKGAYAILTALSFQANDDEIAWIKVDDISLCIIKILRFLTTQKSLSIVLATPLQASFLNAIHSEKSIKVLDTSLSNIAKELFKARENEAFCLMDEAMVSSICPTFERIEKALHVKIKSKGLFISSFFDEERYFHELRLPALFVNDLVGVLHFCEAKNIAYSLESPLYLEHFYPQFITNNIRKKEFGMGEKVLIFEDDETLLKDELAYLQDQIRSEHLLLCLPQSKPIETSFQGEIFYFNAIEECEALSQNNFKYALVFSKKEHFEAFLTRDFSTQPTLF